MYFRWWKMWNNCKMYDLSFNLYLKYFNSEQNELQKEKKKKNIQPQSVMIVRFSLSFVNVIANYWCWCSQMLNRKLKPEFHFNLLQSFFHVSVSHTIFHALINYYYCWRGRFGTGHSPSTSKYFSIASIILHWIMIFWIELTYPPALITT